MGRDVFDAVQDHSLFVTEDDVAVLGTEIELLPDKINALWE